MVDGEVWANIWQTPCIARVCPTTGKVTGWLLMHGLREALLQRNLPMQGKTMDVLNGEGPDGRGCVCFGGRGAWPGLLLSRAGAVRVLVLCRGEGWFTAPSHCVAGA